MTDETEETGFVEGLVGVDGDVGAERPAERDDGCPANGEASYEEGKTERSDPVGSAEDGGRMRFAAPGADGDGDDDDRPENKQRAAVVDVTGVAPGARDDENESLGGNPGPVEDSPKGREGHCVLGVMHAAYRRESQVDALSGNRRAYCYL